VGWRVFATGRNVPRANRGGPWLRQAGWTLWSTTGFSMAEVEDTFVEEAKAQLETNFFGVLRVCRAVLPVLRPGSSIGNISSLAGIVWLPFSGLYRASKFALEGMSESLRFETRPLRHSCRAGRARRFSDANHGQALRGRGIAKRRLSHTAFDKFKRKQDHDEATAPTPEPVASLVERIEPSQCFHTDSSGFRSNK
jgi:NAD(P)-dependent dehydrogenase (short-subunit alcohol dehydrogenase family)